MRVGDTLEEHRCELTGNDVSYSVGPHRTCEVHGKSI